MQLWPPAQADAIAFQDDELVIWVGGDKAYTGIREVGKQFTEDTGIKVKVEIPENLTDRFQQAAASGSGPDILFLGPMTAMANGQKADYWPLSTHQSSFKQGVDDIGWKAMTVDGKT